MTWSDTVEMRGQPVRGLGLAFLKRGLYKIITLKSEDTLTSKQNLPCYKLTHKVAEAYEADANGNLPAQANGAIGTSFENMIMKAQWGMIPESQSEMRESELKTAIVAHGNGTRDALSQANGQVTVSAAHFDNKAAFVLYDPPAPGATGNDAYPAIKYVLAEDVQDLVTGKRRYAWPKDARSARAVTTAVVGGGLADGAPVAGTNAAPAGFASRPAAGAIAGPGAGGLAATAPAANPAAAAVAAIAGVGGTPQQQPPSQGW